MARRATRVKSAEAADRGAPALWVRPLLARRDPRARARDLGLTPQSAASSAARSAATPRSRRSSSGHLARLLAPRRGKRGFGREHGDVGWPGANFFVLRKRQLDALDAVALAYPAFIGVKLSNVRF